MSPLAVLAALDLVEVQGGKVVSKATIIKGLASELAVSVGVLPDLVFRISTALKASNNLVQTHITVAGTKTHGLLDGSKRLSTSRSLDL